MNWPSWLKPHPQQKSETISEEGEAFSVQLKCLTFIGFNREGLRKYPNVFRFIHLVDVFLIFTALTGELGYVVTNLYDIVEIAECCGPLATEIIIFTKLLTYIFFEKKFYQLMDQIKACSDSKSEAVRRARKIEKAVSLTFLSSANLSGGSLVLAPICIDLFNFIFMGADFKRDIPYKTIYPFPTNVSPYYEAIYIVLACATFVTVFLTVNFSESFVFLF